MSNLDYRLFSRRHLPHIQTPGAVLFVTFRLADSMPMAAIRRLLAKAQQRETALDRIADPQERARQAYLLNRALFGKWDKMLDAGQSGPMWLRNPKIADLVSESLRRRDNAAYDLHAYCVMPNHVHIVYKPLAAADGREQAQSAIMHSLKRFTAREANRLLGRSGGFWQHESYDHVVRDDGEWERIVRYVLNNPVAAGLARLNTDWKWSYCKWGM